MLWPIPAPPWPIFRSSHPWANTTANPAKRPRMAEGCSGSPVGTLFRHAQLGDGRGEGGGEKNAGHGWKMLMECLAAGRGICLPATAKASSNTSLLGY